MKYLFQRTTFLTAISLGALTLSSNITRAEPCAIDQTLNNCAPKCRIFFNALPGNFPTYMIRSYAGRDLKDFSDIDLDHLKSDFIYCNSTQSLNMIHGVSNPDFPAFVDKMIMSLKTQRDQQASNAPTNPTQAALLACPTALNRIKELQVIINRMQSQHINTNTQEGMQAMCGFMQTQILNVNQYVVELQECKRNGIVGLQPLVQMSESINEQTEKQYHQACD